MAKDNAQRKYIDTEMFAKRIEASPAFGNMAFEGELLQRVVLDLLGNAPAADVVEVPESGIGDLSDGYHTFNELYHHRAILFSVICNLMPDRAWKSKLHDTGDMFDGMFIVGIETPDGQATYHYDVNPYWDMFKVKELEKAPKWDGHTSTDAINRIAKISLGDAKPKYIDAEKFIEVLKVHFDALYREDGELLYSDHMCIGEDVDDLIKLVEEQPAADVEEVKHGCWEEIKTGEKLYDYCFKCSNCNNETPPNSFVVSPAYCPNCGAKMDGGKAE